jgi:endonuclease/exonuclease/phosphatase family metal-dependent hydrolase
MAATCMLGCGAAADGETEGEPIQIGALEQALVEPIEVMSINVRIPHSDDTGERTWANRLGRLRDTIKYYRSGAGPHLIAAQELVASTWPELHAAIGTHHGFSVNRGDGERLAIWVDTTRFEVLETENRFVSNNERNDTCTPTNDEGQEPRVIMRMWLKDKLTDRRFTLYNTHYPSHHSCERYGMATILANFIIATDKGGEIMVLGDFNDGINTDGSPNGSYQQLLDDTGVIGAYGVRNAVGSTARKLSGHSYDKVARTGKMIDHILVDRTFDVTSSHLSHLMYTGNPGTRVWCSVVVINPAGTPGCSEPPGLINPNGLRQYSDHWAVWARIAAGPDLTPDF